MKEVWKDVVGYEGRYQVSNNGRVQSLISGRTMSLFDNGKGYLGVALSKNGNVKRFYVHRLVAMAFLENRNNYPEVNHKNGDKSDDSLKNLEWCDRSHNRRHAIAMGLWISRKGEGVYHSKLKEQDVLDIVEGLSDGFKQNDIASYYGVNRRSIYEIAIGKSWSWLTGIKMGAK